MGSGTLLRMRGQGPALSLLAAVAVSAALATGCGADDSSEQTAEAARAAKAAAARERRDQEKLSRLRAAVRLEKAKKEQSQRTIDRPGAEQGGGSDAVLPASATASFQQLSRNLGGQVGVSLSGLGAPAGQQLGDLTGGVAWSSIKVAVAQAALDAGGASSDQLARAIAASDNAAAEGLWSSLGGGQRAANAVQAVLAASGDTSTTVNAQRTRPGFTAFGQTEWSLDAQRAFMSGYLCSHRGSRVIRLMQQVVPGQRWGLGSTGRPAGFKGGWGPSPAGPYLVRQMGWLDLGDGKTLVVAMATIAPSGTYEAGARALTQVAQWVVQHTSARRLPTPAC